MRAIMFLFTILFTITAMAQNKQLVIDADTGNELDDFYAITSALLEDNVEVLALISAHFNNVQLLTDSMWHVYPTDNINTVQISQDENEKLLKLLDMEHIPHPIGCDRMVGYAWGFNEGAPIPESPGVDLIIEMAQKIPEGEKLNVFCLGAVTNVASAVLQEPDIVSKIRLYALNMRYDFQKQAWDKSSFNARNDINGLDILLNEKELEMIVIPGNVSAELVFNRGRTRKVMDEVQHPLTDILMQRWDEVSAGNTWIMWDLALVEAFLHPEWATIETLPAPPENNRDFLKVITDVDHQKIEQNFFEKIKSLDNK